MKRLTFLLAFLLIIGMAVFAADVDKLSVSGTVGMSFGDDDIEDDLGPGFSSTKTGAFADIKVGTANDKVEAGITVSLVPAIDLDMGESGDAFVETGDTGYDLIGDMVDWYQTMMAGEPYITDDGSEKTFDNIDFNAIEDQVEATTGKDFIILGNPTDGFTVKDTDAYDLANEVERDHAAALYAAVRGAILEEIDKVSSIVSPFGGGSGYFSAWDMANMNWTTAGSYGAYGAPMIHAAWTTDEKNAVDKELYYFESFGMYVWGLEGYEKESATASTPVKHAYLRVNKIGGVVDVEFEVMGEKVGVGSMVVSDASYGSSNIGLTVALSEGVVPGLHVSLLLNQSEDGALPVSDDTNTYDDETASLTKTTVGTELDLGYTLDTGSMKLGAMLELGIIDWDDVANSFVIGISPSIAMPDLMNLAANVEFNMLLGDELGIGLGAGASMTVVGITPSVNFYMKNAAYGGDGSYTSYDVDDTVTTDSVTTDGTMMDQFNSIDEDGAMALAGDVTADLSALMGMKLISVGIGTDWLFPNEDPSTYWGMDGNIGLDFSELLGAPLTAGFQMGKWADNVITWKGTLGYTYAELLKLTASISSNSDEQIGYSIGGSVSF